MSLLKFLREIPKHLQDEIILEITPQHIVNFMKLYRMNSKIYRKYEEKRYSEILDQSQKDILYKLFIQGDYLKFDQTLDGWTEKIDFLEEAICNEDIKMLQQLIGMINYFKTIELSEDDVNQILTEAAKVGNLEIFNMANQLLERLYTGEDDYADLPKIWILRNAIQYGNINIVNRLNELSGRNLIEDLDKDNLQEMNYYGIKEYIYTPETIKIMIELLKDKLTQDDYESYYDVAVRMDQPEIAEVIKPYITNTIN